MKPRRSLYARPLSSEDSNAPSARWSSAVSVPPIVFVEPREQQSPWVVCRLSSGSAERIRAWLVRLATRSGPSTAGSWQACLAGTRPPPLGRPPRRPCPRGSIRSLDATILRQSQQLIEPESHAHSCRLGLAFLPKLTLGLLVGGERHLGPTYESLPDVVWLRARQVSRGWCRVVRPPPTSSPICRLFRLM